jgi:hypothetical protein
MIRNALVALPSLTFRVERPSQIAPMPREDLELSQPDVTQRPCMRSPPEQIRVQSGRSRDFQQIDPRSSVSGVERHRCETIRA